MGAGVTEQITSTTSAPPGTIDDRLDRAFPGGRINKLVLPGGRRLVIHRGNGARLVDHTGREFVDYLLSSGPLILGHNHPHVVEALHRQVELGTTFHLASEPTLALAERVIDLVPCAEQLRYCSSGSEATMFALRLARAATGRDAVLKFEGAFHGNHDAALMSLTPTRPPAFPHPERSSTGIPAAAETDVLIAPFNDLATAERIVSGHADRLAAVMVEPVQRVISPTPGFLEGLRALCDRYGIVLVFDEVVTGFRLAPGGAQERFGVIPDVCALGKILGGGLPLAAVAGSIAVMQTAAGTGSTAAYVSGTLSGNPLAAAAGLATLDVLQQPGTYARLDAMAERISRGLAAAIADAGLTAVVPAVGPIFSVLFTPGMPVDYRGLAAADRELAAGLSGGLIDRGFLYTGTKGYLSLAHSDEEIDRTVEAAHDVATGLASGEREERSTP
jgi:glutamate-1-semialdehyde 2,1-aminomutase